MSLEPVLLRVSKAQVEKRRCVYKRKEVFASAEGASGENRGRFSFTLARKLKLFDL